MSQNVKPGIIRIIGLTENNLRAQMARFQVHPSRLLIAQLDFTQFFLRVTDENGRGDDIDGLLNSIKAEYAQSIISETDLLLPEEVGALLLKKKMSIATAESCTGGLVAHWLTNVSGSSGYFPVGLITYSNLWKKKLLGVSEETLDRYGAVSEETVSGMARGVRKLADADLGLAISGIAGPLGGTSEKPVGTVYLALATAHVCKVDVHHFEGNRERIKNLSALFALYMVRQWCLRDQEN